MLLCSLYDHHFNDCILIHQTVQLQFTSHINKNLRSSNNATKKFSMHVFLPLNHLDFRGSGVVRDVKQQDFHNSTQIISTKASQD